MGWRAVFFFLVLLAISQIVLSWRLLPETLPREKRQPLLIRDMLRGYLAVLGNARFVLISLAMSLFFLGFFLYIMSAPVFLIRHLKLASTEFGWLFIPLVCGMMAGSFTAARLSYRLQPAALIRLAFAISAVSMLWNVLANWLLPDLLVTRIPQLALQTFAINLAFPSLTLMALDMFPARRGMAASCQGFIHTLVGAIVAGAVAPLLWHDTLWMALAAAGGLVGTVVLYAWSQRTGKIV